MRIDRYLRAAGANGATLRARLIATAASDLLDQGFTGEAEWAEIIAAIDRSLAVELSPGGMALPQTRGRVVLAVAASQGEEARVATGSHCEPIWGVPPRRHQAMHVQDLSLSRSDEQEVFTRSQ